MSRCEDPDPQLIAITDLASARRCVGQALAEVLTSGEIGDNCRFEELGGTSVLAVVLIGRLWEKTGVRLPVTALTSLTTVGQLAASLLEEKGTRRDP